MLANQMPEKEKKIRKVSTTTTIRTHVRGSARNVKTSTVLVMLTTETLKFSTFYYSIYMSYIFFSTSSTCSLLFFCVFYFVYVNTPKNEGKFLVYANLLANKYFSDSDPGD